MNGSDGDGTRWAVQVVVEFGPGLFRHFRVAQWNGFVGELARRGLAPVAWSQGETPPPIGVMFDFRGLRARYCRLDAIDFTFCDLAGADFEGSSLKGVKLGDCRGANLRRARLQGAEFRGDVSGADFTGADLQGTTFLHAWRSTDEPPVGLPSEVVAAIESTTEEQGNGGGPDAPFEQPLRARLMIHEVPW